MIDDYLGPFEQYPTAGPRVARFIEKFCTLGGSFQGEPFELLPFQRQVLDDIYRTDESGRRLRRTYLLGLPRKNGKSQLGAAIALYHLVMDSADTAPLIVSAAGDRTQARLVFKEAARMIQSNPALSEECAIFKDYIRCSRTGGEYRVVSADAGLAQGMNPSCVIVDELHVHKNGDLLEALTSGSGMRNSPLTIIISTAGYDLDSVLGQYYLAGLQTDGHNLNGSFRHGALTDAGYGMAWYGPEPGDSPDPADESLWPKFNPAWSLMNHQDFKDTQKHSPDSAFIRFRLNGWTSAAQAWLPHGAWTALAASTEPVQAADEVVLGFDGSWKGDSTALVAIRLRDYRLRCIGHWETPANQPDYRMPIADIENAIREACKTYTVREVTMDPYYWSQSLQTLGGEGLPVVEFPSNSIAKMVPATQLIFNAVMDQQLSWDHNEHSAAMARHFANVVLKEDGRGGRMSKDKARSHIDIAVAAAIGYSRALALNTETPKKKKTAGVYFFND